MRNNKKAFTLIELLAVIIILAIVALIATPIVLDVVDDARTSAAKSETAMIVSGINNYCATAEMKAQMNNTTSECEEVTKEDVSKMVDLGNAKVTSITYDGKVTSLTVESNRKIVEYDGSTYKIDGEVVGTPEPEEPAKVLYKDNSGANYPELLDNMVPVKYVNGNVVYADLYEEWYDYDSKEWANAVVLNSGVTKTVGDPISEDEIALMYVWIPRYTYTIFNGNNSVASKKIINVKFESGTNSSGTVTCVDNISGNGKTSETCTDEVNGSVKNGVSTYTHPAFTFGEEELTGFWVGKFEISTTDSECLSNSSSETCDKNSHIIEIKPNKKPLMYINISNMFYSIQNMSSIYGLNGDSHMIKNMEWGAVAYLKQSQYGLGKTDIGINDYAKYVTGCGAAQGTDDVWNCNAYNAGGEVASTTGNVYGVYDMSGGAEEHVMGNIVDSNGLFNICDAGFDEAPDPKYYDSYTSVDGATGWTQYTYGKLGDTTRETLTSLSDRVSGGWYDDTATFPIAASPWFVRGNYRQGQDEAGVFAFTFMSGVSWSYFSTRAVLVK